MQGFDPFLNLLWSCDIVGGAQGREDEDRPERG